MQKNKENPEGGIDCAMIVFSRARNGTGNHDDLVDHPEPGLALAGDLEGGGRASRGRGPEGDP